MENEQKNLPVNKEQETVALQNVNGELEATGQGGKPVQVEKKPQKSNKTPILIGIIIVLVLCLAGAVTWGVIMMQKVNDNAAQEDVGQGGQENKPVEEPVEDGELVELALDNALVQRLYHYFDNVGEVYTGTMGFYTDKGALGVQPNKELMLAIALRTLPNSDGYYCNGKYFDALAPEEYKEKSVIDTNCRSGESVRRKINEIFGQQIVIEDGDWAAAQCGSWQYNAENDEFYVPSDGCGGSCFYTLTRNLEKAEKKGDNIYLYEQAYGTSCQSLGHANGEIIVEKEFDDQGRVIKDYDFDDYLDQLDHFKWTFTKNADGEYVFAGLEQIK